MADLSRIFPTDCDSAILLYSIALCELDKAYSRQPPAWRPLTSRTAPTYFSRKRRARRARGRRPR
jgi:hypothetical protein